MSKLRGARIHHRSLVACLLLNHPWWHHHQNPTQRWLQHVLLLGLKTHLVCCFRCLPCRTLPWAHTESRGESLDLTQYSWLVDCRHSPRFMPDPILLDGNLTLLYAHHSWSCAQTILGYKRIIVGYTHPVGIPGDFLPVLASKTPGIHHWFSPKCP